MGTTLRELLEMAGGMSRGKALKFWTPGGSSTPLFTAEHLDVPLDFDSVVKAGSMNGTSAVMIFDEDDCVVRAVLKWIAVLRARVLRQVHAVPRGHLLVASDPRTARARRRHRGGPRHPARCLPTTSSAARSARSATARRARSRRRSSTSATSTSATSPVQPFPPTRPPPSQERTDMTLAPQRPARAEDLITVTIDGVEISVPKGTLIIRAAEQLGIQIPRFCDHPLLDPAGACRQCLVEVTDMGNGRGMPKPAASCTTTVMPGMVVKTQLTSPVADKAQQGVMETAADQPPARLPDLRQGRRVPAAEPGDEQRPGRLPLPRHQAHLPEADRDLDQRAARPRAVRALPALHPLLRADRRRPVHRPARARRPAADRHLRRRAVPVLLLRQHRADLPGRRADRRVLPLPGPPVRPACSTDTVCEHCSSGCALRTDWRRGKITRRLAGDDPEVNEEWNCDKGRWAFHYATQPDRLTDAAGARRGRRPGRGELARGARAGRRRPARGASTAAASACCPAAGSPKKTPTPTPSSPGSRSAPTTSTSALAPGQRRGTGLPRRARRRGHARRTSRTRRSRRRRPCCSSGFEPEEESPIVFLRLRKSTRLGRDARCCSIAPLASHGLRQARRHAHAGAARRRGRGAAGRSDSPLRDALSRDGAVILVGERLATAPGALTAAAALAERTGARLAWVPRRAGERGAVDAGALPTLLPGGRPVTDDAARVEVERVWGASVPTAPGRDCRRILAAAARRRAGRAGRRRRRSRRPRRIRRSPPRHSERVGFVVSLEMRHSAVTERADVVLPVAPAAEKAGRYVTWEGRRRPFEPDADRHRCADRRPGARTRWPRSWTSTSGCRNVEAARAELRPARRRPRAGGRADAVARRPGQRPAARRGAVLATWHELLDAGRMSGRRREPGRYREAGPGAALRGHRRARRRRRRRTADGQRPSAARSPSRSRSPTCPTASCGCRPMRAAARCGPASGPAPETR